ncbi:13237_t:CDS:1 [Dentiscutata erythropus]|uniref:13237_t:CDS:1 n=1 Tax=Dentiscutata erythropus TaxID=1348616 RepID=A0A9N9N950_9GLOM|nr:13237_t:CDS:1 [Dentiscutata erythropus]
MTKSPVDVKSVQRNYLTKQEVEKRVQNGQILIIYNNKVYKLNKWIKHHPGGELAIINLVGKDATDAINVFHPDYVFNSKIHNFYIGEYGPGDSEENIIYSQTSANEPELLLTLAKEKSISMAFRRLESKIKERGLYDCNYWNYAYETVRYIILIITAWYLVIYGTTKFHYFISSICLGLFWHQLAFTAHDAGHNGITHSLYVDNLIGIFIADFLGGLSIGWWKKNHYVHHIVTNHPEHDPDIQHLPFFAITTKLFKDLYSSYYKRTLYFDSFARFFVSYQHYLYYIILCFGRFNLYALSINHLSSEKNLIFRNLEISSMILFWCWFSYLLSYLPSLPTIILYILVSHMVTMILHVQITLSHFGMSTADYGPLESFPRKMCRTTMDVDCPWWMDWFHGGLQFQTIHHLFPRIPRHNLRSCQPLVKEFCEEVGIKYHIYGFVKGNGVVLSALKDVANQVKLLKTVVNENNNKYFTTEE